MNKNHRTADVKIYSNIQFHVKAENLNEADKGFDLIKYKLNKSDDHINEHLLTVTVPREITHDFTTNMILTHPITHSQTILPLIYSSMTEEKP